MSAPEQDALDKKLEAELAEIARQNEAAKAAKSAKAATTGNPMQSKQRGSGIIDRVENFFGDIGVEAQHEWDEFYAPVVIDPVIDASPKTRLGRLYAGFRNAAYRATHNPVTNFIVGNPVSRFVGKPISWGATAVHFVADKPVEWIGTAAHYIRYPFGVPGDRLNAYTRITVNGDFYTRATAKAFFGPLFHKLGRGVGEAGDFVMNASRDGIESLRYKKRSLYWGLRTAGFFWNWGGKQTLGATYNYFCTDKTKSGHRYFSPIQVANSAVFGAFLWYAGIPIATLGAIAPLYYYGSWTTVNDVYVPTAGVFLNPRFETGLKPWQLLAQRDEIWTVQGRVYDPQTKQVEQVRYDFDMNPYFFWYMDIWRPDLAAAKMNSQSPYGAKCSVEVTGIYAKLPRPIRFVARWMNVRPEIVHVLDCEQLESLPNFMPQIVPTTPTQGRATFLYVPQQQMPVTPVGTNGLYKALPAANAPVKALAATSTTLIALPPPSNLKALPPPRPS